MTILPRGSEGKCCGSEGSMDSYAKHSSDCQDSHNKPSIPLSPYSMVTIVIHMTSKLDFNLKEFCPSDEGVALTYAFTVNKNYCTIFKKARLAA